MCCARPSEPGCRGRPRAPRRCAVGGTLHAGPGAERVVPIASVAKVMTAYVILRDHPLRDGDDGPDASWSAGRRPPPTRPAGQGESLVEVEAGERLTERQALEALLLPSADNMAWILARWDAGSQAALRGPDERPGATPGHARHVVHRCLGAGCGHRQHGGRPGACSGRAALQVPALAAIVAEPTARLPVAGLVRNYNTLLGQDGVIGLKTGSTSAAGGCLLFAARDAQRQTRGRCRARSAGQGPGHDRRGAGRQRPAGAGGRAVSRRPAAQPAAQLGRQGEEQVLLGGSDLGRRRRSPARPATRARR